MTNSECVRRHATLMLASLHRALPQDEEAQGDGQEGRVHRRGVGPDRATVAGKRTTWRLMARPPRADKHHPVEAAYGGSLARPARALRSLANLLLKSFSRWRRDGTWDRLLADAQTKSDAVGEVEWLLSLDSTIARAHQHGGGARRKPSKQDAKRGSRTQRTRRSGVAVVR
jgi:transposase